MDSDGQSFIPSPTFQGPKPGYVFSTGKHGTGYYLDDKSFSSTGHGSTQFTVAPAAQPSTRPRAAEELLKEAEEAAQGMQIMNVDSKALKKLLNTLERKVFSIHPFIQTPIQPIHL